MGYTKGEWREYRKGLGFDIKANEEVLATVHQVGIGTNSNAHLIASAPVLYEACLSALGVLATLDQNKGWVKEISGVIQKAIAKAEGE